MRTVSLLVPPMLVHDVMYFVEIGSVCVQCVLYFSWALCRIAKNHAGSCWSLKYLKSDNEFYESGEM